MTAIANFLRKYQFAVHIMMGSALMQLLWFSQQAEHAPRQVLASAGYVYAAMCLEVIVFSKTIGMSVLVGIVAVFLYACGIFGVASLGPAPQAGYVFLGILGIWAASTIGSNEAAWRIAKYPPGKYAPAGEGQCPACQVESHNQKRFVKCTH